MRFNKINKSEIIVLSVFSIVTICIIYAAIHVGAGTWIPTGR